VGAVRTALESLALELLTEHAAHCVQDVLAARDETTAAASGDELLKAVERYAKTT
jgi:DNA-binding FrmR family transcriptional regulator